jgi:hypothetical protein
LPEGGSLTSDDFAGVAGELRRALNWIRSAKSNEFGQQFRTK